MRLYNSLSRKVEEFKPINPPKVGIYTCGPTVYDYMTIGNWRTYVLGDLLVRVLKYSGLQVDYMMNITDVGHLTGDNLGDADFGEDRMEKAAKRETKTAWDIAKFYTQDFIDGYRQLNLSWPKNKQFCKATEHIQEQIELVLKIQSKGFTYRTDDGIYFDTTAFEAAGNKYGELSNLDQIKAGVRVKINTKKKDRRDFALWKFSKKDEKRQMEWPSPWGVGFPGWHIECSAMSMKYLGEQFDIHVGGEDLRSTHHPNEIAQSEAATGKKPFVKYWLHGAFLQVDGGRMGKSLGNAYTLKDLQAKGFSAMELRYFYLTGHYRKQLNFTWEALKASQEAYRKLKALAAGWQGEKSSKVTNLVFKFREAVENDLNMPQALAVVWEMAKSNISSMDKRKLISDWEQILGLDLLTPVQSIKVPEEIKKLIKNRETLRKQRKWAEADELRRKIMTAGFTIVDKTI
ncbi:MAG: Cysteine-tRNA ligase [Candidatus Beckwithbacteria bacterium GW2011_GWA2_43_10]|uniref:Cysteine--tRNA ligase n=1 Tax=Candidatus Beckwithbacteria bacterium GW2011_GWA2_43_10 TaxID=1618369 RepID=A0A0G1E8T6_9BACT|nr:MAG: Cysteine-tRNA ligase [Candidatus Beckwithbacteria bacterium GW2011_GWA2_43_10]